MCTRTRPERQDAYDYHEKEDLCMDPGAMGEWADGEAQAGSGRKGVEGSKEREGEKEIAGKSGRGGHQSSNCLCLLAAQCHGLGLNSAIPPTRRCCIHSTYSVLLVW